MTSLYELFKPETNIEKERHGAVATFGDAKFRIRRAGGYNLKLANMARKYPDLLAEGLDILDERLAVTASTCLVVGWEGVKGPDGQEIKFSIENCEKLLKELPDLLAAIWAFSVQMDNFLSEKEEVEKKN